MMTLRIASSFALSCLLVVSSSCETITGDDRDYKPRPKTEKKLIILGIDGMDPQLTRKLMSEGRLPNLKKISESGTFMELGTTDPPQSPVAWSAFITGLDHGGHGIYDFVHRDPLHLEAYLSTSKPEPEEYLWNVIPTGGGGHKLLRGGEAFWQRLEKKSVGATMVKIPANFPPAQTDANESMSGMGTPDLEGGYGTFQVFTNEPEWTDKHVPAGIVHMVDFGDEDTTTSELAVLHHKQPLKIAIDKAQRMAMLAVEGSDRVVLQAGEWSDWVPVEFGVGMSGAAELNGMVRFYLRDTEPFRLYVSPVNSDPLDSVLHISEPPTWAEEMARSVGRFYTQGMPEDTKALTGGALSDEEFLAQSEIVFQERYRMLKHEMNTYDGGLLFFYFSSIDLISHMYYGSMVPDAPEHYARYKEVVPDTYEKMDKVIGEVVEWAGETPVLIMSDHGFAPWTYKVNLNTWLMQQGYLVVHPPEKRGKGILGHINWDETQAYALGLNQLFLNLEGREAKGVVPVSEKEVVLSRIKRDLESWRYSETGQRVVTEAMPAPVGAFGDRAPDLIVGYARGFRSSDSSAQGGVSNETIEKNTGHWNGDHCMHASHVPGVLFSTEKLPISEASLVDFAPTVLEYFGIGRLDTMAGHNLFEGGAAQ